MIGIVIAAHADLASALLDTAKNVTRFDGKAAAVGVADGDTSASYEERLRSAVAAVKEDQGVLVLTDMFGGTPSNVGLTLHESGRVEVLTGANLPMLIKALQLSGSEDDLATIAQNVKGAGTRAIAIASEVLSGGGVT